MIEIQHLVKKYGNNTAVNDLSMVLKAGKVYGFLGPNGAGKSTTMNMITGYIGATSGEIIINGHDIRKEPAAAKKCIGYLPEVPPLYMDMTVEEYLKFAAELKQLNKHTRYADMKQAMELTKITDVKNRMIRNLSKGYRQRVGLAQAILGFPEIIILDEPTAGLDPKQIIEIRDLIKSLSQKHTVILSSHILSEISEVCDYVFIISKGRLAADDTVENLKQKLSGDAVFELILKASEEEVSFLQDLKGVASCHVTAGRQEGTVNVKMAAKSGEDFREDLFYACVQNDTPILQMQPVSHSLEEVFLEVTGEKEEQK
ncbi:Uncharacterized ABC transporter ATP-binding protein YbhF [uncultured Roseburia sp.]|uniref:ABC transporter ATP-binding protein n=1 Tax=Brotonthovivens ammoniilytica TaxID=2981725 RepID=A0ABT2TFF7_9FIRM|nr:ABC transporter ATP-binding protein [Brotonthovivens ammoniilytica]MCU6760914.1 ABC transporter ATP-binding protein [Brotonthovivens ammoniilytica]SCI13256.1 Uncharacterized ABC transporter ATP-binding protein YbhF [uncultured Roseburia sp.]